MRITSRSARGKGIKKRITHVCMSRLDCYKKFTVRKLNLYFPTSRQNLMLSFLYRDEERGKTIDLDTAAHGERGESKVPTHHIPYSTYFFFY